MHRNKKLLISVTETDSVCPRKLELEMQYKTGQLDFKPNPIYHYYSARGVSIHYASSQIFKNNPIKWNYDWFINNDEYREKIPEWMFNECLDFIKLTYTKAMQVIQDNSDLFKDIISEERMKYPLDDEFILTGKPDLVTNIAIIDWKSNKYTKANAKKYFKQLFGYDYLLGKTYKPKHRAYVLIFLGDDTPKIVIASDDDRKLARKQFTQDLLTTRLFKKQASEGKHLPVKFGFTCGMCKWNWYCRGV